MDNQNTDGFLLGPPLFDFASFQLVDVLPNEFYVQILRSVCRILSFSCCLVGVRRWHSNMAILLYIFINSIGACSFVENL